MAFLLSVFALYFGVLFAVAWFSLHPLRTPLFTSPGIMGSPQEEVVIDVGPHRLRGWWIQGEPTNCVFLYVHGYLMNRSELAPVAHQMRELGAGGLLIDLRAHGKSGGKKCTFGLHEKEDVAAALRWLRSKTPNQKIVVVGSSMGSAASALALADDPSLADALVMDSGYSILSSAITGWWNFLGGRWLQVVMFPAIYISVPLAGFWPFAVDIGKALSAIGDKPILHLHGTADSLAAPRQAELNLAASKGATELVWFEGSNHSEYRWTQPEKYMDSLTSFLRRNGLLDQLPPNT
jgi:uncharacterized protein